MNETLTLVRYATTLPSEICKSISVTSPILRSFKCLAASSTATPAAFSPAPPPDREPLEPEREAVLEDLDVGDAGVRHVRVHAARAGAAGASARAIEHLPGVILHTREQQ